MNNEEHYNLGSTIRIVYFLGFTFVILVLHIVFIRFETKLIHFFCFVEVNSFNKLDKWF